MSIRTITTLLVPAAAFVAIGCSQESPDPHPAASPQVQAASAAPTKTGAQMWAENCSRCHNIRPPQSFSDAQWQTIVHHMRIRANLTGQEARSITAFLQSNNQAGG